MDFTNLKQYFFFKSYTQKSILSMFLFFLIVKKHWMNMEHFLCQSAMHLTFKNSKEILDKKKLPNWIIYQWLSLSTTLNQWFPIP